MRGVMARVGKGMRMTTAGYLVLPLPHHFRPHQRTVWPWMMWSLSWMVEGNQMMEVEVEEVEIMELEEVEIM
jgi:hypothetical protein